MRKLRLREIRHLLKATHLSLKCNLSEDRKDRVLLGPYHLIFLSSFPGGSAHIPCHTQLALPVSLKSWCAQLWLPACYLHLHLMSNPSGMRNSPLGPSQWRWELGALAGGRGAGGGRLRKVGLIILEQMSVLLSTSTETGHPKIA